MFGQNYQKIVFNEDIEGGYYLAVPPRSEKPIGVLLLMPGFGQTAESVFPETKIHNVAYLHDVLTIVVAGGRKLYADTDVVKRLNEVIDHVLKKYPVDKEGFVIGGFSAGGTIGLRYAEYCFEKPGGFPIQPKGVFSIDSPVDLFGIWNYFQREIKKNYSDVGVGEAKFVTEIMESEIGNPDENADNYNRLTPFNMELENYGNEKFLKDMSVRVYHDLDVVWQLENRRRSLFDSNAFASSEMINRLLLMGNERAAFIPSKSPGYRSSGTRHPHSWSIVDEVGFIQWVKSLLTNADME
ncbi:hypothetical protein DN752_16115 [Echinicola strongylocentroti]|uniref:Alpha/beta hydrolase n=1 Tax=Echinicola strongylocentroti TaxID=1795355 RepID=A0A2Z4ILB5_9BACT|nr:hypothetical protein DN752_16115 [Echinicola strongylocentroti]